MEKRIEITQDMFATNPLSKHSEIDGTLHEKARKYRQWLDDDVYCVTIYDENGDVQDYRGEIFGLDDVQAGLPDEFADIDVNDYLV